MKIRNVFLSTIVALTISATANAQQYEIRYQNDEHLFLAGTGANFPVTIGEFVDVTWSTTDGRLPRPATTTWRQFDRSGSEIPAGTPGFRPYERISLDPLQGRYLFQFAPTEEHFNFCPCRVVAMFQYDGGAGSAEVQFIVEQAVPVAVETESEPAPPKDDSSNDTAVLAGMAIIAFGIWRKRTNPTSSFQFTAMPTADDALTAHASMQFTDNLAANLTYDAQLPENPFADVHQRAMLELKWAF